MLQDVSPFDGTENKATVFWRNEKRWFYMMLECPAGVCEAVIRPPRYLCIDCIDCIDSIDSIDCVDCIDCMYRMYRVYRVYRLYRMYRVYRLYRMYRMYRNSSIFFTKARDLHCRFKSKAHSKVIYRSHLLLHCLC